jgi:hypothetical protein
MTVADKISRRVERMGAGAVFTRADFLDLGTTDNVGMILSRLQTAGKIRRISRGLYESPRTHPVLGKLSPHPEAIVKATSRRSGTRHQPSGAQAANLLQLTEQVPARVVYQTDGPSKTITEGHRTIQFQHRSPRGMAAAGRMSGLVFAALREIGKANVTQERVFGLRSLLSGRDRRRLIKDLPLAPAWMHPHLRWIASATAHRRGV